MGELTGRFNRLRQIGREIAALNEEAKRLRSEVLSELATVNRQPQPENPTRMLLHGTTVVTVALSKDEKCKDCSVTFEDYPQCEDVETREDVFVCERCGAQNATFHESTAEHLCWRCGQK